MKDEFDEIQSEVEREDEREERTIYASDKLLEEEFPEETFLIDTLFPNKGLAMLAGDPSSFKSWIMLWMVKRIAEGEDLWVDEYGDGFETEQGGVLWVDEEVNAKEIQRRWGKLSPKEGTPIYFMAQERFRLPDEDDREWLIEKMTERELNVVVFDSFRAIHGLGENDSEVAQKLIDCLQEFANAGFSVLVSHHKRKIGKFMTRENIAQLIRGSSAFLGGFDSVLMVESERISELVNDITFFHAKLKQGPESPNFKVRFEEKEGKIEINWLESVTQKSVEEEQLERDMESYLLDKSFSYGKQLKNVMSERGYSARTVERVMKKMRHGKRLIGVPEDLADSIKEERGLHPATKLFKWNS